MCKSALRMLVLSVSVIALLTGFAPLANASVMFGGTIPAFDVDILNNLDTSLLDSVPALTTQRGTLTGTTLFNNLREFNGGLVVVFVMLVNSPNRVGDSFINGPGFAGGPAGLGRSFDSFDDTPGPIASTVPDSTSSLWLALPAMFLIAAKRYRFQACH